ncbi:MAG: membrane protein insertion efficiency factor YidD [Candidatus Neomarinimicrobiota bacterium]
MKIINYVFILIIRSYQIVLSPLFPKACRFEPTCSQYAVEAFREFGFFKALFFSTRRILKCHPYHSGGYDPIPTIKE